MKFLDGDGPPVVGPSLERQPMRGMQQALMDKLSFCKKITEACVLDEVRHVAMKGWKGGSKTKIRKTFGGWL